MPIFPSNVHFPINQSKDSYPKCWEIVTTVFFISFLWKEKARSYERLISILFISFSIRWVWKSTLRSMFFLFFVFYLLFRSGSAIHSKEDVRSMARCFGLSGDEIQLFCFVFSSSQWKLLCFVLICSPIS